MPRVQQPSECLWSVAGHGCIVILTISGGCTSMPTMLFRFQAWGFLLVFCSNYSVIMHRCWATDMGQIDRQTEKRINRRINGSHHFLFPCNCKQTTTESGYGTGKSVTCWTSYIDAYKSRVGWLRSSSEITWWHWGNRTYCLIFTLCAGEIWIQCIFIARRHASMCSRKSTSTAMGNNEARGNVSEYLPECNTQ